MLSAASPFPHRSEGSLNLIGSLINYNLETISDDYGAQITFNCFIW